MNPEVVRLSRPPTEIMDLWFGRARDGGYIALGSRRPFKQEPGEAPRYFTVIPVSSRQMYFPQFIAEEMARTKYIGTNTFAKSVLKIGREVKSEEQFTAAIKNKRPEYFTFTNKKVRELVTILVDLDVGREGTFSAEAAVGTLVARALHGHIPHPSMIGYSGRGAYAIWLLREKDSPSPPLHTPRNAHVWKQITDEIFGQVSDLYPDNNARRLAQWVKAPGTIDTKTGNEVVYLPFYVTDDTGKSQIPLYSIDDLVEHFGIVTADDHEAIAPAATWEITAKASTRRATPAKITRAANPLRARYRDLESLAVNRRGMKRGDRYTTCFFYYQAVWGCYSIEGDPAARSAAKDKMFEFNAAYCRPPLPDMDLTKIYSGNSKIKARSGTIIRSLKITVDEAEQLDLRNLAPQSVKDERKQVQKAVASDKRGRREFIVKAIKRGWSNKRIYKNGISTEYRYTVSRLRKKHGIPDPVKGSKRQLRLSRSK